MEAVGRMIIREVQYGSQGVAEFSAGTQQRDDQTVLAMEVKPTNPSAT